MAIFGKLEAYDVNASWASYVEQTEQFFLVNDIPDDKKAPILLASIGNAGYELLKKLSAPALPSTKSYDELKDIMSEFKHPTPSKVVCRYKFHMRTREPGESVSVYLAELRKLSTHCDFGASLVSVRITERGTQSYE